MPIDNYTWHKSRRKSIAIQVDRLGEVIVKTPHRTSQSTVEAILLEKRAWIEKQRALQSQRIAPILPSSQSREVYILGRCYALHATQSRQESIHFDETGLYIAYKHTKSFDKQIKHFYTTLTQEWVEHFYERFKTRLDPMPHSITYRIYKARWGCCYSDNRIRFNALLGMRSKEDIQYVVAHELAHLRIKRHDRAFYNEGERILPDFKRYHKDML